MVGLIAGGLAAAAVSAGWSAIAPALGPRLGIVDRPGEALKVHTVPAVPLGGVGLYGALVVSSVLTGRPSPRLMVAAGLVVALGLVDDRRGLPPVLRLVVEAVAGVLVAWALGVGPVGGALVAAGVVVGINAVNLFDGLDGLVASVALVTLVAMGLVGSTSGADLGTEVALGAALVGFGVFNWHPARVFLGDNGSYLVGLMLVASGVRLGDEDVVGMVAGGSLLGVFLVDLVSTVLRRRRAGVPLFQGDRSHLYDRLADRGWSVPKVVFVAAGAQALLCGAVVAAWWWAGVGAAAVTGVLAVVGAVGAALKWG